ncbi:MAG TPA: hypothetical protein VN729_09520, partial [Ktedonobacteraceae bacterium]|nr:hypothetical protein [Ktedonobacteraceae bacterium]
MLALKHCHLMDEITTANSNEKKAFQVLFQQESTLRKWSSHVPNKEILSTTSPLGGARMRLKQIFALRKCPNIPSF